MIQISLPHRLYLMYLVNGKLTLNDIKEVIFEDLFIFK